MRGLRKLLWLGVSLGCVLAIPLLLAVRQTPAAPGQIASVRPGDINCDGELDISDPVRLLQYLFLGGAEPCAVAQTGDCCPTLESKLDRILAVLEDPCKDSLHRLEDHGDRTVTDLCTGLQWQQRTASVDVDLDGFPDHAFNFNQAKNLASADRTGGFADWRVPTLAELEGLVQLSQERPLLRGRLPELDFSFTDQGTSIWTATETRLAPGQQGEVYAYELVTRPDALSFSQQQKTEKLRVVLVRGPNE